MGTAVVHLIGHPGVGKFTIAAALKQLAESQDEKVVVMDNHRTANIIFPVVGADGVRPLPPAVWDRIGEIREVVYRTIEEMAPAGMSFVFTNVLIEGHPEDVAAVERIAQLAKRRAAPYVPVLLTCGEAEHLRRVAAPGRAERMKWVDPRGVRSFIRTNRILRPATDALLELDVTTLAPQDAAARIRHHMARADTSAQARPG